MKSFKEASEFLGKKQSRPLGGHSGSTRIERLDDGSIGIKLHQTFVVVYHSDGEKIVLNSGGWKTVTTKERICSYSPVNISQEKGVWYVTRWIRNNWKRIGIFQDGCIIYVTEKNLVHAITGLGEITEKKDKENNQLLKRISRYCADFISALLAGNVKAPGAGDCLYCHAFTDEKGNPAKGFGGNNHIDLHMKEKYYVPSLLMRAIERFPVSQIAKMGLSGIWQGDTKSVFANDIMAEQCKKSLYRFIKEQFNFQA